jgi:DNA-binding GntR family transcriptional regulator
MSTDRLNKLSLDRGAPPRTATQYVLEALRDGIATRKLEEGQQLVQNDIAETLNVSRMPVREALRILEAEGWVEFSPRRGAVVASLSVNDVPQIFEIRFALEALALRKSVPAVSSTILDRAASFLDDMDAESDIGRWVDLNRRFHLTLYAEAGARLLDLIESQYAAVDRYLRLELAEMHNADESQEEHRAILAACRAREVEEAVMLLEPHIYEAGIDLANALSKRRRTPE